MAAAHLMFQFNLALPMIGGVQSTVLQESSYPNSCLLFTVNGRCGPHVCLTCNDVSRQGHIGYGLTSPLHQRIIGVTGVAPLHALEDAAAPTLSGHVQVVAHVWVGSYDLVAAMFGGGTVILT